MRRVSLVAVLLLVMSLFSVGAPSLASDAPVAPTMQQTERAKQKDVDWSTLPVEFRGGRKLIDGVSALASGTVYVAVDAGHGKGYGSTCTGGCYTGYQATGYNEDEMNRKVALRLFENLDVHGTTFLPAVSRWIQNNDRDAADWDSTAGGQPESGDYAIDHMFTDAVPLNNTPDTTWSLSGCDGQPSSCKDNKRATLYDRAAHANQLSVGSAAYGKIFVSIHFDSGSTNGPTVWVQPASTGSTAAQQSASTNLGKAICARIYELRFGTLNSCSTRVFTSDLAVLREANNSLPNGNAFPVVLIEVANLAPGSADRTWLGTGSAQDTKLNQIGDAMYNGIVDWYNTYN
jgi:N-acetylmuramoyl-L-alanine amidase